MMRRKLLISSPAPIRSTSESATSETTSALRSAGAPPRRRAAPALFERLVQIGLRRLPSAGARPKMMPVKSEMNSVKRRTLPSSLISAVVGSLSTLAARSTSMPHSASSSPTAAADEREQHALRQELADDAQASRAERRANRDLFACATRRAPAAGWRRWRTR